MNNVRHHSLRHKDHHFIFLSLIFCLSCASTMQQAAKSGIIRGIVVNENNQPVKGAIIEVKQVKDSLVQQVIPSKYSDIQGKFDLGNVPDSTILLIIDASSSGYVKSENYLSQCTGSKCLKYSIIKNEGNTNDKLIIFGKVTDVKGESIFGASVQAFPTFYGDASDKEGNFKISDAPPGDYQFRAAVIEYNVLKSIGYRLNKNDIININFKLKPTELKARSP